MTTLNRLVASLAAAACLACTPTLDWREFVPEGSGLSMTFPCRPDRHARPVTLAGSAGAMEMLSCKAGADTFAVAFVDLKEPAQVAATLVALRTAAVGNVQGFNQTAVPWQIKGMTPNEQATRLTVLGRLPDGTDVQEHAAFFSRGLRVYQVTVLGAAPTPQAIEPFFAGLKFPA